MDTQKVTYRDHTIETAFAGWKVREAGGAYWPEKYANLDDARKSIDFTLKVGA